MRANNSSIPTIRASSRSRTVGSFIAATALLTAPVLLRAQSGAVAGRVFRMEERIGVPNAEVLVKASGASTRTDSRGYFTLRGLAAGDVEIAIRRPGFIPARIAVTVNTLAETRVEIRLEAIAPVLDPIVTSATPLAHRSMEAVPGAVSVADSAAINRGRTVGLHETLRTMPGVQATSRYGTDDANIGIRGSAARARQAVRGVAVLLDGVPLTEPDGVARLDMIELAAARQVEVVRGPASALYAGSAGGVVNVISRTGHDSPGIIASGQAGDFGFRKFDSRAGGLLGDGRSSWMAAASQTSTDGYRAHSDAQITRGQMLLDFASASTRFSIQGVGSRLDSRLPGSLTQSEIDKDPRIAAPPATAFQFGRGDDRYRVGAQLDQEFGTGAANTYFFYGGRTLDFPIPFQIVDLNLHRIQGGGRLRSNRIAELPLDVTIGVDYDRVFGTDRRRVNNAGVAGALRDDGWFAILGEGVYAQLEWRPIAQVETTIGVRDDRVGYKFQSKSANAIPKQDVTFNQASPRFTTVWHPRSVTTVYASAGRGFEPPAVGELSASPGNPVGAVHPKSLWNFELGARHLIANRVRIDGAAFVAAVRGEFVPVTVGGLSFPENASHSRNAGVELGVTALATRWLDFSAAYTFLDLRLTDYATSVVNSSGVREQVDFSGKQIPGVSRNAFSAEASLRPFDRLSVGVQTEYQGLVYVETSNARGATLYVEAAPGGTVQQVPFRAVPARALFHLKGDFRVGKLNVFARVENLFAQKYVANVIANESSGRFYEPGSRRSASIGLSVGTSAAPGAIP